MRNQIKNKAQSENQNMKTNTQNSLFLQYEKAKTANSIKCLPKTHTFKNRTIPKINKLEEIKFENELISHQNRFTKLVSDTLRTLIKTEEHNLVRNEILLKRNFPKKVIINFRILYKMQCLILKI